MSYTVMISRMDPPGGGICRPPENPTGCHQASFYWVVANSTNGSNSGSPVCAEHLFPAIGHFLGFPAPHT